MEKFQCYQQGQKHQTLGNIFTGKCIKTFTLKKKKLLIEIHKISLKAKCDNVSPGKI